MPRESDSTVEAPPEVREIAESQSPRAPACPRRSGEALAASSFVWIVFAAMLAAAFVFVARYSSGVPFEDDLEVTQYVGSGARITPEWLWLPFNEHRIPLPRLLFVALMSVERDIRSGMYFDVLLLGAVSAAMILAARKLRGRTSYSDAFFPLLWLTWGNYENLLKMHQVSLMVPSAITAALLLTFAASPEPPSWKKSLWIGACLFSLPLCGAPGLTPAPALILWCGYAGWKSIRASDALTRRGGRILLASALATAALIAFYFHDFPNPASASYNRSALDSMRQALGFLTLGFGPAGHAAWPFSGWLTALLLLVGLATLILAFRQRVNERLRVAGILAIGAGIASMALSTGIARGGDYEYAAFAIRYVTLPAPILCCVYFASILYGPAAVGRLVRVTLCSILFALVFFNVREGKAYGELHAEQMDEFQRDIERGMDVTELAVEHWPVFYIAPKPFKEHLEILRDARFGPLASVRPSEPAIFHEMFVSQPMLLRARQAVAGLHDGQRVLWVSPESTLHFNLGPRKQRVKGRFGIDPAAYTLTRSGGVRFSVELLQLAYESRTIFERVLTPADGGFHELSVEIPAGAEGELILRTSFAGDIDAGRAFCFWTEIEIYPDHLSRLRR